MEAKQEECCPRFSPGPWDEKEITLDGKRFVTDRVRSFMHIPLNFGAVMKRNMERIEAAGAKAGDYLLLTEHNSLWGADVFIAVDKEVPGSKMAELPGTFLGKVFEGPYSKTGSWVKEMKAYLRAGGRKMKRLLFFYTTCPSCAKKYGANYVVLLARQ